MTWARERGGEAVVLTFDRHPLGVIRGSEPPTICTLEHRLVLIGDLGVDHCVVLRFDAALAAVEPEDFVERVYVRALGARGVVMGFDSRFGHKGRGDAALLESLGRRDGFEVRVARPIQAEGGVVSSTVVRRAIVQGDLARAASMLGRSVELYGEVVTGDRRGRLLGFPTANLDLGHEARPPRGVYAATVGLDQGEYGAVVNIGRRPTFERQDGSGAMPPEDLVEVHVLDFDGDLYGRSLRVRFLERLRDERRFEGPEALVAQIRLDVATFRVRHGGRLAGKPD